MQGRFITTAVAALAAMAIGPAYAAAAPSPLTDTDYAGGTPASTWIVEPGALRLEPAVNANFDGSALPSSLVATQWTTGVGGGTVAGGALTVDGAHVNDANPTPTSTAPQTLEFRATFANAAFQNVGFGDTFNTAPWAMFSTGGGKLPDGVTDLPVGLYARTMDANGAFTNTPISGVLPGDAHTYRIEWATNGVVTFYVDNNAQLTPNAAVPSDTKMRPVASDYDADVTGVKVDWLATGASPSSGSFISRVLAADDAHTAWGSLTTMGVATGATFETRSGNSLTPDGSWSGWKAVGTGGAIQSPGGRQYIQYKATLTSAAASLDSVAIDYAIDSTAPSAAIDGVQVSGTTATITFSSPAADLDGFECSVDGAPYAPCTSPKQVTGLSVGSHSVFARAIDKAGNTGAAVSKSFVVDPPASATGTTGAASSTAVAVDKTAPKVSVVAKSLRASKRGTIGVRVGCPVGETRCKVTLQLKRGHSVAAHKTVTVLGGKTVTVTLQLSKATRKQLASHGSLKVTTLITASDAAGNKQKTKQSMTLRAPKA